MHVSEQDHSPAVIHLTKQVDASGHQMDALAHQMDALEIKENASWDDETYEGASEKPPSAEPRISIMDFWVRNVPCIPCGESRHKKNFILDEEAPGVTLKNALGELMRHQSSAVWMLSELENARELCFTGDFGMTATIKTNRYKFQSPIGSGKTKTAIGLILHSPRPAIKPIYWVDTEASRWLLQERIFNPDTIIWPTVIIARSSIYSHWHDQIAEFSKLRVLSVGDSKSLISFVHAAMNNLTWLNATYDVIVVDYKTISGKTDAITNQCAAIYEINTKKSKHLVPLMFNTLSRRCFARVIYDDSEFHMKAAAFENASSCIYLSATHQYGTLRGASKLVLRTEDLNNFEKMIEFPTYTFDMETFNNMITVSFNQQFLEDSGNLGIPDLNPSDPAATADIKMRNMMPAEPEVWLCPIVNAESKAIDIIGCLCDDAKIMESVNSLTVTSFAEVIKSLMAGRFEIYKNATRLVSYWSSFDLSSISKLPKPPEGLSFTVDNLRRCEPIMFAWRDIANRITDLISDEQKVIDNERKVLERVKDSLGDSDCGICLEGLRGDAVGIMLCCNKILHIKCILKWSARRCPFCRTNYGVTSKETFAPMHHETDFSIFAEAKTATLGMESILKDPGAGGTEELTKLSVLRAISTGRFAEIKRTQIRLKKLGTIVYDSSIEAKCEDKIERLKILIYSSADDTLKKIEAEMPIQHAHLTASASSTAAKIKKFRTSVEPSAILANSWRDAAGIDFKTATDVVIMNYVDTSAVVQQMVARLLRMGRVSRARIWLISFQNECDAWLRSHCEALEVPK